MKNNQIIIPVPDFYSVGDKEHFFQWLYSLRGYKNVVGAGRELCITFRRSKLSQKDGSELVAIFSRYRLEKKVLRGLLGPASRWSRGLHWFGEVFK